MIIIHWPVTTAIYEYMYTAVYIVVTSNYHDCICHKFCHSNECIWHFIDNIFQGIYRHVISYLWLYKIYSHPTQKNSKVLSCMSPILLMVLKNCSPILAMWLWEMADGDPQSSTIPCNAYGLLIIWKPWCKNCGKVLMCCPSKMVEIP